LNFPDPERHVSRLWTNTFRFGVGHERASCDDSDRGAGLGFAGGA